jgi:prepilin-type N-terminal cleavage/methylation domain-containing protein
MVAGKKKQGFTLIELLTVLGIIALLVGILIPSLTMVRTMAKRTQQSAQLTGIEFAMTAFRNDTGYYPPSNWTFSAQGHYCGAQKLAIGLLGADLLGFHPMTNWNDPFEPATTYYVDNPTQDNLRQRLGPYLEVAEANAFRAGWGAEPYTGLFEDYMPLDPATFLICDVFAARRVTVIDRYGKAITRKAGTPVLYYRANLSARTIDPAEVPSNATEDLIYNAADNRPLIELLRRNENKEHPLGDPRGTYAYFYDYITDPTVEAKNWPHRPESYILISAGPDGEYGTADDICNF